MSTGSKTALRSLLLILLLTVQGLCHAHQVEHVLDGDGGFCSICSVTGHGDAIIVETSQAAITDALPQDVPACTGRAFTGDEKHLPDTRAPPLS